ncbi:ATP-binding cassette domain-containing protein [Patescibacteria group bacterium]|nr:ATP-binding cassette domain-containing protein [Patescibacteria group bacterium]
MLKIENISKSINNTKILKNINLELNDGEILGLLGPNGAGKTTLMRIITGYYSKNTGEVILDDKIINNQNIEFLKKQIGYLPENNPLYEDMTVEEYLKFCLSIHNIKKEEQALKIKEVIESCSIKDRLKDDIKTLSKGLQQRVGLAGALIHNPKILILDEPTTGLDPNQILEIRELIKKISKDKTIMISTHIMQEVEAICDRVIIIDKGEIVLSSNIKEIKAKTENNILKAKIKAEENISDRVKDEISTINNVLEVSASFDSGEINIEIKADSDVDLRHDFMKYIQIHNYDLLEIIKKESTLEDIFKKLTK